MPRRPLLAAVVTLALTLVATGASSAPKSAKVLKEPGFDRQAAASALASVDLHKCKVTNVKAGQGHATITFAPSGEVAKVVIDGGEFKASPVSKCLAAQFRKAKVPSFRGAPVSVGKTFRIE